MTTYEISSIYISPENKHTDLYLYFSLLLANSYISFALVKRIMNTCIHPNEIVIKQHHSNIFYFSLERGIRNRGMRLTMQVAEEAH